LQTRTEEHHLKSNAFFQPLTRLLPALLALCAGGMNVSALAQAAASGPVEGIKAAAGKVGDAVNSAGQKLDAATPRTEAYKKKEVQKKMEAKQASADKSVAAKKKAKKAKAKPAA
jgi:hypothetical protein